MQLVATSLYKIIRFKTTGDVSVYHLSKIYDFKDFVTRVYLVLNNHALCDLLLVW